MTKLEMCKFFLNNNKSLFTCPKCNADFDINIKNNNNYIKCESNHCFDLAKKGYINFIVGNKSEFKNYNQSLFENRKYVFASGFFDELIFSLANKLDKTILNNQLINQQMNFVDFGCGEGSLINSLANKYSTLNFVGLDISKEAIIQACSNKSNNENVLFTVADLVNPPFNNNSIDIILNMLTPANYDKFDLLLKENGCLIKIIPNANYLSQFREFFYSSTEINKYSNEKILSNFYIRYDKENISQFDVTYEYKCDEKLIYHLIKMSPLTHNKTEEDINKFISSKINYITLDLKVLIYTK